MKFKYGTTIEIEPYFKNMEVYKENDYEYYSGFDLMTPYFFEDIKEGGTPEDGCQYLLCLNDENTVIGILKWKRYGVPHHEYVSESEAHEKESYIAIRFVDVKSSERKKGIAKALVRHWSENFLNEYDKVVGGKATPIGQLVNIHKWLERELSQNYYISELEVIEEYEENEEEW